MPIYEYRCASCGEKFDELLPMGTTDAPPCPGCGAVKADRLVSLVARTAGDGGGCGPGCCGGSCGSRLN